MMIVAAILQVCRAGTAESDIDVGVGWIEPAAVGGAQCVAIAIPWAAAHYSKFSQYWSKLKLCFSTLSISG